MVGRNSGCVRVVARVVRDLHQDDGGQQENADGDSQEQRDDLQERTGSTAGRAGAPMRVRVRVDAE